ncbi:MAG: ankyrin repeat domain-containing protein [Alphaproteobacteria bacterium]|nr:ankyrin repeat domain-containing protein [Alphaproteobacteria bacterium]
MTMQGVENAYMLLAHQLQSAIDNNDMIVVKDLSALLDIRRIHFVEMNEETDRKISKPVEIYVAEHGSVAVMEFILDIGGNVNARDSDGNTPLMIAVNEERKDMISFLLKQPDIQVFIKNNYGETAETIARFTNDDDIISSLNSVLQNEKTPMMFDSLHCYM